MPRTPSATESEHTPLTDLTPLAESFRRSLRARNKSPRTVDGYLAGVHQFDAYLRRLGMPTAAAHIRCEHVESFVADQVERHKANTAATRYRALQQIFRWLVEEGELPSSPMANMRPPEVPESRPAVLSEDEIRRLLRACAGHDFLGRRDAAIIRTFADTGMRVSELTGIRIADFDLDVDTALVLGKGRRPRICPFAQKTAAALDRYLRARAAHRLAARPELWLGHGGPLSSGKSWRSNVRPAFGFRGWTCGSAGRWLPQRMPVHGRHP